MFHALVGESCNAPGTSTFQVAGALTGCVAYSVRFADGSPCFYLATDGNGNYEAGMGTFHSNVTPNTISRDTVTENSLNTTTKISFAGTIQVINFLASDKAIYTDNTGNAHVTGNLRVSGDTYVAGNLRLETNGDSIYAFDTGNVARLVFSPLDANNCTDIYIGGGLSSPVGKFQVLNIPGVQLFGVDYTGNATIKASLTTGGVVLLPNSTAVQAKDASAAAQNMILIDASNNLQLQIPNASSVFRVLNHAGSVSLFQVDNAGAATHSGSLHVTGAVTLDSTVTVLNNAAYYGKDTGGTIHPLMLLDASNDLTMWIPLSNVFRVVNTAFAVEVFKVDNLGNATVHNALSVGAVTTTAGLACTSNLFVQGTSTLTGDVGCSGALSTFGATGSTTAGWEYGPSGGGSLSSSARNFGVVVGSSVNVLANAYDAYSDIRLKTDIKAITPDMGLAFVRDSQPCTFMKAGTFEAGFVAQDMIRAGYHHLITHYDYPGLPELDEDGLVSKQDVALSMVYDQTIAYITAAMKGAFARIEALETRH